MIRDIFDTLLFGANSTALQLNILSDGLIEVVLCRLNKSKSTVSIIEFKEFNSIDSVFEVLKKGDNIALSIDGKGVVSKKIYEKTNSPKINQLLPGVDPDAFFIQESTVVNNYHFVSAIRTNTLNEIIKKFNNKGIQIINISLSIHIMTSFITQINDDEIITKGYKITKADNSVSEISECNQTGEDIKIGNDIVKNGHVLAFAASLQKWIDPQIFSYEPDFHNYKFNCIKQLLVKAGIVILLSLLTINYLVFSSFHKRNIELNDQVSFNNELLKDLNSMKKELQRKDSLFVNLKDANTLKRSYIIDLLIKCKPDNILLEQLTFENPSNRIGNKKRITFESNVIRINGSVDNTSTINKWITEISTFPIVEKAFLINYEQKEVSNNSHFEIKIILNEIQ